MWTRFTSQDVSGPVLGIGLRYEALFYNAVFNVRGDVTACDSFLSSSVMADQDVQQVRKPFDYHSLDV